MQNLGGKQSVLWGIRKQRIKGPDFDSVLHKVLYCVILKQFIISIFTKRFNAQIVGASTQHPLLCNTETISSAF